MSSIYGTRSKNTADVAEFRTARMFTTLPDLYSDLKVTNDLGETTTLADAPDGTPIDLTQYRGTDRDAGITFKRVKIGGDDQKIYDLRWHQDLIDWDVYNEQRAARVDSKILSAMLEPAVRTTVDIATLEYFITTVKGEFSRIPAPFEDNGQRVVPFRNADFFGDAYKPDHLNDPDAIAAWLEEPHEMAGEFPPRTAPWLELWDEALRTELLTQMQNVHGGRTPSGEITFPSASVPVESARPVPLRRGTARTKPA